MSLRIDNGGNIVGTRFEDRPRGAHNNVARRITVHRLQGVEADALVAKPRSENRGRR